MITKAEEILRDTDGFHVIKPGTVAHSVATSSIEVALIAGEANYRQHLVELCAKFGWRTDGSFAFILERVEHHIRDMKAGIKARDVVINEKKV